MTFTLISYSTPQGVHSLEQKTFFVGPFFHITFKHNLVLHGNKFWNSYIEYQILSKLPFLFLI